MVRKILKIMVLNLMVLSFVGTAFGAVESIVAVVNNEVITQKDINEFAAMRLLQHPKEYKDRKELEEEMQKWRKEAVERIIEERLIIQEAKLQKVTAEPEMIKNRLDEVRSQFPSTGEFENNLISSGLTQNDLKRKIEEQLMMQKIVDNQIRDKVFVSPSEITAYYEGHINEISEPEQADVDSVVIPAGESEEAAQKQAEEAYAALQKGEDFSAVAKRYSYSQPLGKISRGEMKKEIEEVVFNLKKGEYSSPVRTENGFYIFKLIEMIPSRRPAIDEVRDKIYRVILAEKFDRQFAKWIDVLKAKAYINVK